MNKDKENNKISSVEKESLISKSGLLDSNGFNLWAKEYDEDVRKSDEKDEYPFAKYNEIMDSIYSFVINCGYKSLLDIGFGTAQLTKRFYDKDIKITGLDFSLEMIKIAKEKMPDAKLIKHDFTKGLENSIKKEKFDCVICTYAIHHLNDEEKVSLINDVMKTLSRKGVFIIGDVITNTQEEMNAAKENDKNSWDEEEFYIVVEELKSKLLNKYDFYFKRFSSFSGILIIKNK